MGGVFTLMAGCGGSLLWVELRWALWKQSSVLCLGELVWRFYQGGRATVYPLLKAEPSLFSRGHYTLQLSTQPREGRTWGGEGGRGHTTGQITEINPGNS